MSNKVEIDKLTGKVLEIASESELRPYKSYVALLTQYSPIASQTSGVLIVGGRYTITTYNTNDDFSNVAQVESGTINTTGCVFIATGTTPTHWTHLSDLEFDGAPIANILENELSALPVISYNGVGNYTISLTNEFVLEKTFISIANCSNILNDWTYNAIWASASEVEIYTYTTSTSTLSDDILLYTPIEIRVYN